MARLPDLRPPGDVPAGPLSWIKEWLRDVRLWAQTREPNATSVGNPVDKFTTRAELIELGVIARSADGGFQSGVGTVAGPAGPSGPPGDPGVGVPAPDLTPPPTPTGLTATGAISHVLVQWDAPVYTQGRGNEYTHIYGAIWLDGDAQPTFGDVRTKRVGSAAEATTIYAVPSNPSTRWCIWVAFQTRDGVEGSPAGGTHGAQAETGVDVSSLLAALTGQITQSQLFASLSERITQINTDADMVVQKFWGFQDDLEGWTATNATLFPPVNGKAFWTPSATNPDVRLTFPSGDRFQGVDATIVRARARRTTGTGTWEGNCYYRTDLASNPTPHGYSNSYRKTIAEPDNPDVWNVLEWDMAALTAGGTDWLDSEIHGLRIDLVSDATSTWEFDWIAIGTTSITPLSVAIAQEQSVRENETGALFAQYTVKIDLNGYVTGYGLAATAVDGVPSSSFIVRADQFAVAPPTFYTQSAPPTGLNGTTHVGRLWRDTDTDEVKTWDGDSWEPFTNALPFIVQTTRTVIDGVTIEPGVYMDAAFIVNLTATYAQIQSLVADDIVAAEINVAQLTAGSVGVGSYIQSTGYVAGVSGWRIHGNGFAEFGAADIRGQLSAAQMNGLGLSIYNTGGVLILDAGGVPKNRASATINAVTFAVDGSAVGHSLNTDGSCNITLDWAWSGAAADIDGFRIFHRVSTSATPVVLTSTSGTLLVYEVPANRTAATIYGAPTDKYHTFAVQGYRRVESGVSGAVNGMILGTLQQPSMTGENPYQPSASVAFTGNVTGTIDGTPAADVVAVVDAVNDATTGLATRLRSNGADILSGVIDVDVVTGSAGFRAGNLAWNTSGVRTGGYGVAMTTNGLLGYNAAGNLTFALNATTGDLTLGGSAAAADGYFIGTVKVGTATRSGTTMLAGTEGAIFNSSGTFSLGNDDKNLTFNGTALTMNGDLVVTGNLVTEAATILRFASAPGPNATVNITVPADFGGAYALITASISCPNGGFQQTLTIDGTPVRTESVAGGTIPAMVWTATLAAGAHAITIGSTDGAAGNAFVAVLYSMR